MGRGCLGRLIRAAGFDDYDGLGERNFASRRKKGAGIANRFHINDDAFGLGVIPEIVDEITPTHVEHGTQRDKGTETHILSQAPV